MEEARRAAMGGPAQDPRLRRGQRDVVPCRVLWTTMLDMMMYLRMLGVACQHQGRHVSDKPRGWLGIDGGNGSCRDGRKVYHVFWYANDKLPVCWDGNSNWLKGDRSL